MNIERTEGDFLRVASCLTPTETIEPAPTSVLKTVAGLYVIPTLLLLIAFDDGLRMFIFMFVAVPGWIFGTAILVCYGIFYAMAMLWRMVPRRMEPRD
jgi:hypothetical protein